MSVSPPLDPKGGEQHSLAGEGGGPNSDDWIEGQALCILSGLGGNPNSIDFIYSWGSNKKQRSCDGRGGARSAPFGVAMS